MKKILVIGWDSADWGVARPLMDAGMMPGLKSLIENGASGNIKTLEPSFSPILWTSIATGKLADKHNILGFLEPNESGEGVRPISGSSRKAKAVWNILQSQKYKCNVIGWWPSHPAEPVNGVMVSNLFHQNHNCFRKDWEMAEGSVWPKSLQDQISDLRVHPSEISAGKVQVFVPDAAKVNQDEDDSLQIIQTLLAETESVFNATMWALQNTEWDFTAVYFNELDKFSHHFMKFHPPQLQGVSDESFQLYHNVVTAAYTYYDVILQYILKTIPSDTTVILLSDHGFHSGDKRKRKIPDLYGGAAIEHNPLGMLCIKGPGIKSNETIYAAGLLDITPTVLTIAGLPVGEDMDGEVLFGIFNEKTNKESISSWEKVIGDFCTQNENSFKDTFGEVQALQQLVDLGYIEKLSDDAEEQINNVIKDRNYNLSVVYASSGRIEKAIELLENLYQEDMVDLRFNFDLINFYIQKKAFEKARKILSNFRKFDITHIPNFDYQEGRILSAEDRKKEALQFFLRAKEKSPRHIGLLLSIAATWFELENTDKSISVYKEILELDKNNTDALHGLSVICNYMGSYDEAIGYSLEVLKADPTEAAGHYQIGYALYHSEEYEAASKALEVCLNITPNISRARNLLLNIYRKHLINDRQYEKHYQFFMDTRKGEVVVVSGLPRSGTSMMMQMLQAGGVLIACDDQVTPDENNPKGYFEYEPVKRSMSDTSWLEYAEGKAVKVIAQLLPYLRLQYRLKIIFMERNTDEVLLSQQRMLVSRKKGKGVYDIGLRDIYRQHMDNALTWAEKSHNVDYICLQYKDVIMDPAKASEQVNQFLGGYLNEKNMAEVVDAELYRVKC